MSASLQSDSESIVFQEYLGRVAAGDNLTLDETHSAIDLIMRGDVADAQIALFLTALHEKGESVHEIAGAAAALRQHMTHIRSRRKGLIDTCGTGGDNSCTFNISTAAALVTAAAGLPVAKHGNRSITSRTGSADVLSALGVNIQADATCVEECLDTLGICFCFAPLLHPAMKRVGEVRKQLTHATIFNLLGPLANPAGAPYQLLGVGKPQLRGRLAEALALLGTERAVLVTGDDGLDEVTLATTTRVTVVEGGQLSELVWSPADFGLATSRLDSLLVDGPQKSAVMIEQVLNGQQGPAFDIVVINAAAALWTARKADSPMQCAELAQSAIESGAARELLARLVEGTNR
ncbi:MAG: anthranilate phosphoribosyltransferase [Pirellulales bacterium]